MMSAASLARGAVLSGVVAFSIGLYGPGLFAQSNESIVVNGEDSRRMLALQQTTALIAAAAQLPEHVIVIGADAVVPGMVAVDENRVAIHQTNAPVINHADSNKEIGLDASGVVARPNISSKERIIVSGADAVETYSLGLLATPAQSTPTTPATPTAVPPTPTDTPIELTTAPPAQTDVPPTPTNGDPTSTVTLPTSTDAAPAVADAPRSSPTAVQEVSANEQGKGWLSDGIAAALITALATIIAAIIGAWAVRQRHKDTKDQSEKPDSDRKSD